MTLLLLALALSMAAFAVARGAVGDGGWRSALRLGLSFGLAQGLMLRLGWLGIGIRILVDHVRTKVALHKRLRARPPHGLVPGLRPNRGRDTGLEKGAAAPGEEGAGGSAAPAFEAEVAALMTCGQGARFAGTATQTRLSHVCVRQIRSARLHSLSIAHTLR